MRRMGWASFSDQREWQRRHPKADPELRCGGGSAGLDEDEQCQGIGGGYKAGKFRFLLFL
jgi:hypothetical protein